MLNFRVSKQMKKILLVLLRETKDLTKKKIVELLEGDKAFYGQSWGKHHLEGSKDTSYGRSLAKLMEWGLIDIKRYQYAYPTPVRPRHYFLTEKGREKALEVKKQIENYIKEWQPLIEWERG